MSNHNDDQFLYRRKLSQPMAELLADPFSELTRKRHTALLIAATVTLLLSAGLVNVGEVGVAGITFTLNAPNLAKWLALTVTFYLLIVYLLGVRADWTIAKAKHWSPLGSIADVKAEMVEDHEARVRAGKERLQRLERLQGEQRKIEAEIRPRLDAISARYHEIESMLTPLIESTQVSSEELTRCCALARESTELCRSELTTWTELTGRLAPVEKAIKELVQSISLEPANSWWRERADIEPTIRDFSRLTQLRLVVEILFPAAYAAFALVWTVLHSGVLGGRS